MAWIKQVPLAEATGLLKKLYDESVKRAGRVWNILHVMSVNPPLYRDNVRVYGTLMHSESPLSRVQREMLATVVSAELDCHY